MGIIINENLKNKKRTDKAIRKDIINTIYAQIDTGYTMGDRVFCFYEKDYTKTIPDFVKFYNIVKIGNRYEIINKEEGGDFFQITKNGKKIEASGFGLEDIIRTIMNDQNEQYAVSTITNEKYFEIKLKAIKDEFTKEIRDIKCDIDRICNWKKNFCVDYNILLDKVYKIGKKQEIARTMLIIISAIILLGFPIIKLLILINK